MGLTVTVGLTGSAYSIYNLRSVEAGIKQTLAEGIDTAGKNIAETAKRLLRERIAAYPQKEPVTPSTGKLERAIKHSFNPNLPQPYSRVHVDERMADYGEYVEFGHFAGAWGQTWFPGYHFMGDAFKLERAKIGENLKTSFAKELAKYDVFKHPRVGTRIRHRRTGRFVAGA